MDSIMEERRKSSYRDSVLGANGSARVDERMEGDEGEVSDDDAMEKDEEGTWFAIGMTKEEKREARKP